MKLILHSNATTNPGNAQSWDLLQGTRHNNEFLVWFRTWDAMRIAIEHVLCYGANSSALQRLHYAIEQR